MSTANSNEPRTECQHKGAFANPTYLRIELAIAVIAIVVLFAANIRLKTNIQSLETQNILNQDNAKKQAARADKLEQDMHDQAEGWFRSNMGTADSCAVIVEQKDAEIQNLNESLNKAQGQNTKLTAKITELQKTIRELKEIEHANQ